jgi:hypothetical protein
MARGWMQGQPMQGQPMMAQPMAHEPAMQTMQVPRTLKSVEHRPVYFFG